MERAGARGECWPSDFVLEFRLSVVWSHNVHLDRDVRLHRQKVRHSQKTGEDGRTVFHLERCNDGLPLEPQDIDLLGGAVRVLIELLWERIAHALDVGDAAMVPRSAAVASWCPDL